MSTAPTSASIPIQEFRVKLQEAAVEARGASYQSIKAFIFRSEDDATWLIKLQLFFPGMHDVFAIDDIEDFAIEKTSKFPVGHFLKLISAKVSQLMLGRSLHIVAYIGHAILISENLTQKMLWSMIHDLCLTSTDDSIQNLEVLALLDCGYAGSAVRAGGNRHVQLLAACAGRCRDYSRKDGVTFTQRFRRVAYSFRNAGNTLVDVESLFGELQPDYNVIGNARPLVLPLGSSAQRQSLSSSIETNILFMISLAGGPSGAILQFLPEFKITLDNAYGSNSIVLQKTLRRCQGSRLQF
ncbi:hypothetical protein V1523DRAFT_458347 [Lipomyces doorenjongii]